VVLDIGCTFILIEAAIEAAMAISIMAWPGGGREEEARGFA
jgi:hypothetical protein